MSLENPQEEIKNETAGMTRRSLLKGGAALIGSAILAPAEILSADPGKKIETLNEGEPGVEYLRGMQDLHGKAKTGDREFFAVYKEQEGVGEWLVTEENERSVILNLEETKRFMGENPSHSHFVHTHPERWVGTGWSPPSLGDIQSVVATNFFFEGQGMNIKHQAVDSTGVWTFKLDPTSRFAVAMRYIQTKMPDVANTLIRDARFQRFVKGDLPDVATEDHRTTGRTILENTDRFGFSTRRTLRKMGRLEETLLGDFALDDFDSGVFSLAHVDRRGSEERLEDLKRYYEKIGVTLSYESSVEDASAVETGQ